jgi:hypothetical protein
MKFCLGAAWATLAFAIFSPAMAAAQSTDAFVLPWGMFRLSVQGTQESFDSRFDASGNRVPITQGVAGDLTPDRFASLRPLSTNLTDFFEATDGGPGATADPVDPETISLGTLDVRAAALQTHALARLTIGLLPRVEIGASVPIQRGERTVQRLALAGGSVGINPNPSTNGALLASIGWGPLGASDLLPVADSPEGIELLSRVTALAGEGLILPTDTANSDNLQALLMQEYNLAPLVSRRDLWRVGDAELFARVLLISTFGQAPLPVAPTGPNMRLTISGGLRLPTGTEPDSFPLLAPLPAERLAEYHAGATGDFFFGSRAWVSAAARLTWSSSSEITRRVAPADAPLSLTDGPTRVTITPGNRLEFAFAPRYQLVESISIGVEYTGAMVGDTEYSGGGEGMDATILNLAGGGLHRLGMGIRYSTLPAYFARRAAMPAEVSLTYQRTIAGPEGAPAAGALAITASLLPQLWGR